MKKRLLLLGLLCAIIFAAGSRETDSLALVALLNSNPQSPLGWNTTTPINNWNGVTVTDNRVSALILFQMDLSTLPQKIGTLSALKKLSLPDNALRSLPAEIGQLQELTCLHIYDNNIESVPTTITNLTKMTELWADQTAYDLLPKESWNCFALRELGLLGNGTLTPPDHLWELTQLEELIVYGYSNLSEISSDIKNLVNLTKLSLWNNALTTLPSEISALKKLKKLNLDQNAFRTFPDEISSLNNLEILDLNYNRLEAIPPSIGALRKLTHLNLTWNKLTSLPKEVRELENLMVLSAEKNELISLPTEIDALTQLMFLQIQDNKLHFADLEAVHALTNSALQFYTYDPQDSVPTYITTDSSSLFVEVRGSQNRYQWFKNGELLAGDTLHTITLSQREIFSGRYNCKVTSDSIPDVALYSQKEYTSHDGNSIISSDNTLQSRKEMVSMSVAGGALHLVTQKGVYASLSILNIKGQKVYPTQSFTLSAGHSTFPLTTVLGTGIYIAKLETPKGMFVAKFSIGQ